MKPSRLRIIVTGLIAQHPLLGGVTWDYLQYVLGLARLGHDVYYFEDSGEWPYTPDGGPSGQDWIAHDCTPNVNHLAATMDRFGLAGRWAYRFPIKARWFGLSAGERRTVIESADLLLNVSGTLRRPADYRQVKRLVYIDSDPVFTQVKLALPRGHRKFRKRVDAHDVHMSFGEACSPAVPETGHRWRPTRQPIVLSEWRSSTAPGDAFTTVMSWTSYRPLRHAGQKLGQKDVELRRFLALPARVSPATLEIALNRTQHADWEGKPGEASPEGPAGESPPSSAGELLVRMGWRVADAARVAHDLDSYRQYIQVSKAEWSVAKNGYVRGQAGWFSCRSACYLAAGRPVVVQDTGFGAVLPVGEGILSFRTMEEAVAAIREVEGDYARHAKAARAIAEECFDSDKVLTRLIEDALGTSASPVSGGE
jgi:hypothetical protein